MEPRRKPAHARWPSPTATVGPDFIMPLHHRAVGRNVLLVNAGVLAPNRSRRNGDGRQPCGPTGDVRFLVETSGSVSVEDGARHPPATKLRRDQVPNVATGYFVRQLGAVELEPCRVPAGSFPPVHLEHALADAADHRNDPVSRLRTGRVHAPRPPDGLVEFDTMARKELFASACTCASASPPARPTPPASSPPSYARVSGAGNLRRCPPLSSARNDNRRLAVTHRDRLAPNGISSVWTRLDDQRRNQ